MPIATGILELLAVAVLAVTTLDCHKVSSVGVNLDVFGTWAEHAKDVGGM